MLRPPRSRFAGYRSAILPPADTHAAVGCTTDVLGPRWRAVTVRG